MEHEILFQNPVFHNGLNVTVRDSHRWMKVNIDDWLQIRKAGEPRIIINGRVVGKALLPFRLVPTEFLEHEHDPSCRTKDGLFKELKRIYPNFSEQNIVTVLFFNIPNQS